MVAKGGMGERDDAVSGGLIVALVDLAAVGEALVGQLKRDACIAHQELAIRQSTPKLGCNISARHNRERVSHRRRVSGKSLLSPPLLKLNVTQEFCYEKRLS
jgi:hypothetical protein